MYVTSVKVKCSKVKIIALLKKTIMWQSLTFNNQKYFVKQQIENGFVITTLSDMINIWIENLSEEDVVKKFKDYNPLVKANKVVILKFLSNGLKSETNSAELQEDDSEVKLTIKNPVGLKYVFNLAKQSQETVYKEVTLPLILIINELKHREDVLFKELKAKDTELLEFKLEGYKITRRNVITTEFKKDAFENDCNENLEERVRLALGNLNNVISDVNELYSNFLSVISSSTVDLLKEGKLLEIKKENSPEESNTLNNKEAEKRTYPREENISIKKLKRVKKSIL